MNEQEEMALRELAAKPHYLPKVAVALGPLSLWSKAGIEAEIRRAVEAEREECIKLVHKGTGEPVQIKTLVILQKERKRIADEIKARGTT